MRNCHHPEHSLFSDGILFQTTPPNFFFFSINYNVFLHSLLDLPMTFAIACLFWIAIPLLFLNKFIFAGKITDCFILLREQEESGICLCLFRPSYNHPRQLPITMTLLPRTFISTLLCCPNPTPGLVIIHNYCKSWNPKVQYLHQARLTFLTIIIPVLQNYEKQQAFKQAFK